MYRLITILCISLTLASACKEKSAVSNNSGGIAMKLTVTSTAFKQGEMIPSRYTCDGDNISPQLSWSAGPAGTKSYCIIADDPDAPMGTWVHWVLFNMPADKTALAEGIEKKAGLADGSIQGITDFRKPGYGGPCPPSGIHRYFFKVYALDSKLDIKSTATKKDLEQAINGHILASGELMGKYQRK